MQENRPAESYPPSREGLQGGIPATEVAAQPGYVRLVLPRRDADARAACRKFARLCREESACRGLIVARSTDSSPPELENQMILATRDVSSGFKLGLVVQGAAAGTIAQIATSIARRRQAKARIFSSEHRAAGWLMS